MGRNTPFLIQYTMLMLASYTFLRGISLFFTWSIVHLLLGIFCLYSYMKHFLL